MNEFKYDEISQRKELESGDDEYSYADIQFRNDFHQTGINYHQSHIKNRMSKVYKKKEGKRPGQQRRLKQMQKIYTETARDVDKMHKKKSQVKKREVSTIPHKQFNSSQLVKINPIEEKPRRQTQLIYNVRKQIPIQSLYNQEQSMYFEKKQNQNESSVRQKTQKSTDAQGKKIFTDENKREKNSKRFKQFIQIQDLVRYNSNKSESKKDSVDIQRQKQIQAAKEILSGKISIIWIFVIGGQIDEEYQDRILKMYNKFSTNKYIAPLCKSGKEIKPFLQIKNSIFKIVSDLENIEQSLRHKIKKSVVQYYIYNEKGEKGVSEALEWKSESRKIKAIYTKLDKIIIRAQDQLQNQIFLYQTKNGISKRKHTKYFPSFLKLSGSDKTQATNYRSNLFGAKNLPAQEKMEKLQDFLALVKSKYFDVEKERKNIEEYQIIDHKKHVQNLEQAKKIIQFYVRQSFYYQILNSMLRTMKTTDEFRPCILPFNETYHAIKCFYKQKNKGKIKKQTLYRGAKIRKKDLQSLKPNTYIQIFGFMSTSKNFQRAKEFTGEQGHMFVIEIPERTIDKKFSAYDHGFVDINENKLAPKSFQIEEQILFNALNVFKVKDIQEDEEGRTLIKIEYGVIFDLLSKKKADLTDDEKDVLLNYQYCIQMLSDIEDQGDVHLLANQFEESKNYYAIKLDEEKKSKDEGKLLYKLANVQHKCGQLEEADKNTKKSLQVQLKELDKNDRQKCLKVFSIHSKNAQINLEKQDYLEADDALTEAIELLNEEDDFQKAKKIRHRGQIKFKKGQIKNAESDFNQSEKIFKQICDKGEERRKKVKQQFIWKFLTFCCQTQSIQEIQTQKEQELKEISSLQQQINNMKDSINDELIKVNNSLKDVAEYAEDREKYEICVKKARSYLLQIQARKTNDPRQKAKLKALQATVQDYLDLAQSEKLLNQAIALVQEGDPYNEEVGKYSSILAKLQKENLQKFSNPKCLMKVKLSKKLEPIPYNGNQHKQVYDKCKKNYEKAINVMLYNNKSHKSPQIMSLKNQLGELDYNQSNYESSQKIIQEVKKAGYNNQHSEVSKSCLLLSKIAYSRGELKNSFENIEEAKNILRKSIVKKDEDKYHKIYQNNETYLQVKLHRSKIYLKQLKHDLSLKDIEKLKTLLTIKLQNQDFHSLLPEVYELEAENYASKRLIYQFDEYFQKAIQLREKQIGTYNLANAVAYCNYAKYLIFYQDIDGARNCLDKSMEIFSCFSADHPITWLVLYCYGVLKGATNNKEECLKDLEKCIQMALKKFDKSHITMSKIRLKYAKELQNIGNFETAIRQFEKLEEDLDQNLKASSKRSEIERELDDEKITVKKILYTSLQNSYKQAISLDDSQLQLSQLKISSYQTKILNLKSTYKIH